MFAIEHPSERTLTSLWSEDLPAAATESILVHLESCDECAQRLASMDSSIEQYRRLVKVVDAQLPDPPRPWANIWSEMDRVDRPARPLALWPAKTKPRRPIWIGAVAAAILLAFLMWPRGGSVARAETLLLRATSSAGRSHSRKRSHLRVVTQQALFVRPAVLASDGEEDDTLRAQFLTARFDWSDPLSAEAFRGWRGQLRQKADQVSESGEPVQYRIQTTTADSVLRDASIVFEGPDLTPVSLRLVFDSGGWVEITSVPEAAATTPAMVAPAPANITPAPGPVVTERQLAGRELAVRLAINKLSDTPVPVTVEVAPEGNIIVTPYHLSAEQERQLSESLSGKEGVRLNPTERGGAPTGGTISRADEEPAIATAGIIAALAHLLAEDADRFPPAREVLLDPAERAALTVLRLGRTEQLISQLDKLDNQLSSAHEMQGVDDSPGASGASALSLADLAKAAGALNRLVTSVFTTGADHVEASVAWPELTREMGEARRLVKQYERYLKPHAEERR